jgi:hypothetical protein
LTLLTGVNFGAKQSPGSSLLDSISEGVQQLFWSAAPFDCYSR